MVSIAKYIVSKNNADNTNSATLLAQKNSVLGKSSASASTSSVLGKTDYKKDRQNISGIVLG